MLLYKSSLSEIQSRICISVWFPSPACSSAGMQPALSVTEFPRVLLCKYTLTGSPHPGQLPAPEWVERPDKLVLFSKEARVGEGKCECCVRDGGLCHTMNAELLQLLQSLWRFCIDFQNFNSSLNFLANKDKAYCGITNNQNFLRFSTLFKPPRDPGCPEQCTQQDRNGKSNTEK